MRLGDLFSSLASAWPVEDIDTSFPPSTDGAGLAGQMADTIEVEDFRTDVAPDGTLCMTGTLSLVDDLPPAPTTLVTRLFPSMGFVFAPSPDWSSDFRLSTGLGGERTLQVDTLPLEIRVPPDLLGAHPDPTKQGIDAGITLSDGAGDTVIERDFSFTIDGDGAIRLLPHLPVSVGPCRIFGVPAISVHDLSFISAPAVARADYDWLVRGLDPDAFPFEGGGLGFGGIELDWEVEDSPLHDLRGRLRIQEDARIVLEDLVVPATFVPPLPRHGHFGIRRSLDPGEPLSEFLSFQDAPVIVPLGDDAHLFLSRLFFSTPADGEDWWSGLTLEGGVAWEDSDDDAFEIELGLIDGDVLRLSFSHPPAELDEDIPIIRLDLWKILIDIFRVRAGVSLVELAKDSPDPGAAVQALIDLSIREKPDDDEEEGEEGEGEGGGSASGDVRLTTEDGQPFTAALVDVGWDRGKPSGNMVMPRGAQLRLSRFALEIRQMGLVYEQGATYFAISGGIREKTSPLEGSIWFERLRGRVAGNPDAPGFLLGGLGAELEVEDVVEITVHGSYREEVLPDGTRVKEQGLGGGIVIHVGDNEWGLTLDVFWGERVPVSGDRTDYLLLLVALFGAIPMGPLELRGIEALYADSLAPRIDAGDREAGELKYYSWLKRARPTAVPESRGLDNWKPARDAWAFGFGIGLSFTGAGDVFQLKAFGLGFDAPDAAGLVIVIEFGMFDSKKPIALGVFEYDFRRDAFVLMIQLDLTLDQLIDNFPEQLKIKLGGTITIGNKPGLIALGRLNDPDTWIGGKLELELSEIAELKVRAGFCVEWMEDTHVGGGFMFSLTVSGSLKVIELEGWGALEVLLRFMLTGTNDFVARLRFELGFAVTLFGFLRFGVSVEMLAEWLAHVPNFFVFRVTFRFETPWFLPDVSYTLECTKGTLEPAERAVVTSPLLQASGSTRSTNRPLRVQRLDGGVGGSPTALTSVNAIAGATGAWQGTANPLPLDATVEIDFSVMLADELGIGSVDPDLGRQASGDGDLQLITRYALKGITMRRRPLAGGPWEVVEELTTAASPRNFRWLWDVDTRTGGKTAPKKLLLNGRTPFTVGLDNPLADAATLEDEPAFPCCAVRPPDVARFDFAGEEVGPIPAPFTRPFTFQDRGTVAPLRIQGSPCAVRPPIAAGATEDRVGAFLPRSGQAFGVVASEDIAGAVLRLAVGGRGKARLVVVALDGSGAEVARLHDNTGASAFVDVPVVPVRAFRSLHVTLQPLQVQGATNSNVPGLSASLILDSIDAVTAADKARFERDRARCDRESTDGRGEVVNFLARHEYEIALTTEVGVEHSATDVEAATVTERVSFVTAGPPGLNETEEPGLELAPYVVSPPPGGSGLTYREESVHLVLSDALRVFGPGSGFGTADPLDETDFRLPVTLAVEAAFESDPRKRSARSSRESADWFLANRAEPDPHLSLAVLALLTAMSRDRGALRYRDLVEASTGTCAPDDVWHEAQPRIGVAPFDPSGRPLWGAKTSYTAVLRLAGSPVVERAPFEPADLTSLSDVSGAWSVVDGALTTEGTSRGTFGETTWDLFALEMRGTIGGGGQMGAAVLVDPARPDQGVRAVVRRGIGSEGSLVLESMAGSAIASRPLSGIGPSSGLLVEVFADAIRCSCGDTRLSVARGDRGTGRCQLLGTAASITALRVRGIDMYRLPFRTSRYQGLSEHIRSCTAMETYDAGTASEPLASIFARLAGRIAASMSPDASNADREVVFDDASSALALPLREDPARLHVTVARAGSDRWFLLESPEPIDFAREVELTLERRVVHPGLSPADRIRLGDLIGTAVRYAIEGPSRPPFPPGRIDVRRRLFPDLPPGWRPPLPRPDRTPVYSAELAGRHLKVTELATGAIRRVRAPGLTAEDREFLRDVVADLNARFEVVRWHVPDRVEWVGTEVQVIQNADATKALALPEGPPLADGTYRLSFAIVRPWFETTDPVGPGNAYLDEATLLAELV